MVTLLLDSARLEIALSPVERALAFRSEPVHIPRATISKVQLTDDPWTWIRGIRGKGTHIPRVLALGAWTFGGGSDFVVVRRNFPGLVIDLDAHPDYSRCVLSTRHAAALVQALRLETGSVPVDVVSIVTGAITTHPELAEDESGASADDVATDDAPSDESPS